MDAAEYERRHKRASVLADFFRQHQGEWIEARFFETVAGRQGWRTRISDLRVHMGMTIENKQTRVKTEDGFAVLSEYRYLPFQPLGRDASEPMPTFQRELFQR